MEKKRDISRLVMQVCAVLLCLTLLSMWLMSNMYARYTTQVSGEDSARVAIFGHDESIDVPSEISAKLVPGSSAEYALSVANYSGARTSEVTLNYNLEVATAGNLPLQFTLYSVSDNGQRSEIGSFAESSTEKEHTFPKADMAFEAGTQAEHKYVLDMQWDGSTDAAGYANIPDYIRININVEQAD